MSPGDFIHCINALLCKAFLHFCGQVNGKNLTFVITDDNIPDSYIALFPNFAERPPAERYPGTIQLNDWEPRRGVRLQNPSRRVMPERYFMFLETPLIALRSESHSGVFFQDAYNVAIGFR